MNKLDPSLKRLLKWSRSAGSSTPASQEAPFGFTNRVLASARHPQRATLLQELQQSAWLIASASLAVLVCAGLLLISQRAPAPPEPEVSSAMNFVANSLLQ